jgi:hypothetical protein
MFKGRAHLMFLGKVLNIWRNRPKLSFLFWFCSVLVYALTIIAVAAILNLDFEKAAMQGPIAQQAALKLSTLRLGVILIALIAFPILLFKSLDYLYKFLVGITAWAVVMYIDDHLLLYKVIEYPNIGVVNLTFATRPFGIMAMLWMCFELNFRKNNSSELI